MLHSLPLLYGGSQSPVYKRELNRFVDIPGECDVNISIFVFVFLRSKFFSLDFSLLRN